VCRDGASDRALAAGAGCPSPGEDRLKPKHLLIVVHEMISFALQLPSRFKTPIEARPGDRLSELQAQTTILNQGDDHEGRCDWRHGTYWIKGCEEASGAGA
jgi:hypothetical protein